MGRKGHVNFRARISLSALQRPVQSKPIEQWPAALCHCWKILTAELGIADADARSAILESISAARRCVLAQNQRLLRNEQARMRRKIQSACLRVTKCLKRGPAALRGRLGKEILSTIDTNPTDLEVLESILEMTRSVFAEFPGVEPAKAGSGSLKPAHFSAISASWQSKAERAVDEFKAAAGKRGVADLFAALAAALADGKVARPTAQIGDDIIQYLEEIAQIWRKVGLKSSAAHDYLHLDPSTYRSRFHQFSELVITWVLGLHRGKRHDVKPWCEASLKSEKYKWFVSYDHIRTALRADSNFASKNVL
jgi:hypothetical protein